MLPRRRDRQARQARTTKPNPIRFSAVLFDDGAVDAIVRRWRGRRDGVTVSDDRTMHGAAIVRFRIVNVDELLRDQPMSDVRSISLFRRQSTTLSATVRRRRGATVLDRSGGRPSWRGSDHLDPEQRPTLIPALVPQVARTTLQVQPHRKVVAIRNTSNSDAGAHPTFVGAASRRRLQSPGQSTTEAVLGGTALYGNRLDLDGVDARSTARGDRQRHDHSFEQLAV